jgi:hypothetical protein
MLNQSLTTLENHDKNAKMRGCNKSNRYQMVL